MQQNQLFCFANLKLVSIRGRIDLHLVQENPDSINLGFTPNRTLSFSCSYFSKRSFVERPTTFPVVYSFLFFVFVLSRVATTVSVYRHLNTTSKQRAETPVATRSSICTWVLKRKRTPWTAEQTTERARAESITLTNSGFPLPQYNRLSKYYSLSNYGQRRGL